MIVLKVLAKNLVRNASEFQTCRVEYKKFKKLFSTIITVRLGYHKFCAIFVPKMLMSAHKVERMALPLISLEHHKDGNKYISQSHRTSNR
jgi:hypothetical protein